MNSMYKTFIILNCTVFFSVQLISMEKPSTQIDLTKIVQEYDPQTNCSLAQQLFNDFPMNDPLEKEFHTALAMRAHDRLTAILNLKNCCLLNS